MSTCLSKVDFTSLQRLATIRDNQVIDIGNNGTVSMPYESNTLGRLWRTGRWISGYGQNRDDIPNIAKLMERAAVAFIKPNGEALKTTIEESINGLKVLKSHYEKKGCKDISQKIQSIIQCVNETLTLDRQNVVPKLTNEQSLKLTKLDASMISYTATGREQGVEGTEEGIYYFIDKINDFLTIKKPTEDDRNFLNQIKASLESTVFVRKDLQFYQEAYRRTKNDGPPELEFETLLNQNCEKLTCERLEAFLNSLDRMPPLNAEQIGLSIPMSLKWKEENEEHGHAYFISLCKNQDGTYTASQHNAGDLSLAANKKLEYHFSLKFPCTLEFSTVVEFPSLNKSEAFEFLKRAEQHQNSHHNDSWEKAEDTYNKIFAPILHKKTNTRIPPRRGQIVGNCGIRSLKELLIYNFQKADKVELANTFLTFMDSRTTETLPFEKVKAFLK